MEAGWIPREESCRCSANAIGRGASIVVVRCGDAASGLDFLDLLALSARKFPKPVLKIFSS